MNAHKSLISDIFNNNRVLEIPFYQRSYVWETAQWERFLIDMEYVAETNRPYFLGAIILKQQETLSRDVVGDYRTVVDGQQRLTTINLFFKALCLKTQQNELFNVRFGLMSDNSFALKHNHNDLEDFNRVLRLETYSDIDGDSNIIKAFKYFYRNVDIDKCSVNLLINNLTMVNIDLGKDEDEQQIFDTINSLGVRLTTAELLKNYFFSRNDVEYYNKYWKSVFEKDEVTKSYWDKEVTAGRIRRDNIDLFFYAFLLIKINQPEIGVTSEDRRRFSRVEHLFESYKAFVEIYKLNKKELIKEIKEYANVYSSVVRYDVINRDITCENSIARINTIIFGLEHTTLIPYFLYVNKEVNSKEEKDKIFHYLESYLMRRLVCHATTKNYNQLFSEQLISNRITGYSSLHSYLKDKSDKVNYFPTDDELLQGFHNSKLINKQATGILYLLESKVRDSKSHATGLLGFSHYSLEHVMPKKWENHWHFEGSEEERMQRNKALLTLGNLTIIPTKLNTSIRDSSWNVKVNGNKGKSGLKHYASGIELFSTYIGVADWDEQTIKDRASFLYKHAMKIWSH